MKTTAYVEHSVETLWFLPTLTDTAGWDLKLTARDGSRAWRYWLRNPSTDHCRPPDDDHGVKVEEWNGETQTWEVMGYWGSVAEVRELRLEGCPWGEEGLALDFLGWASLGHYDTIQDMIDEWNEADRPGMGNHGSEGSP